jgi:hypothetical protein
MAALRALVLLAGAAALAAALHPHAAHPSDSDDVPAKLLRPPALQRLPTGATKPLGWLKDELALQARGLSGQLPYFWLYFNQSAWMGEKGRDPQQFLPYYLQGMIPLSYQLDDANLVRLREQYIAYILANQTSRTDGWLGPPVKSSDPKEYWSKYDMIEALEFFAEAEPKRGSEVKASLVRHHAALYTALKTNSPDYNQSRWGVDRYSDGLVGIQWLLDQGEGAKPGGAFLWELLRLMRTEADSLMAARDHSWERWFDEDPDFTTGSTSPFNYSAKAQANGAQGDKTGFIHLLRHGVDIGQAMKTGALWWRVDGEQADWKNGQAALDWAEAYLHRADGMYFADEEVEGQRTPSRGTETCSVVETMFSMRAVYEVTANITFMDRLETIAFNSLPAALWPDATANVYHHADNQIETGTGGPYAYDLYFCCSANVHQGWPKFVFSALHLEAAATAANPSTIVISGYSPTVSTLPDGRVVTISGSYPFADTATVRVSKASQLRLRVPCWTEGATVAVGGGATHAAPPCAFFNLTLSSGPATLNITFINKIRLYEWQPSQLDGQGQIAGGGIEVHRGPLVYSLRPESTVVSDPKMGGQTQPYPSSLPGGAAGGWPTIMKHQVTIAPNASWNYAIDVSSLTFETVSTAIPKIPFAVDLPAPVQIRAKARRVQAWTTAGGARGIQPLPHSPLSSTEPLEDIVLVPRGATNIRVTVFPQLCEAGKAGCPPPPPPGPPTPPPAPAPGAKLCHPKGALPPSAKLDVNLPNGDLVKGGAGLGAPGTFNVTECYQRCLAWNAQPDGLLHAYGGAKCDAWVATSAGGPHPGVPHCWLKSHAVDGGYQVRAQACYVSAECTIGGTRRLGCLPARSK